MPLRNSGVKRELRCYIAVARPYIRILAAAAVRSSPERRCLAAGTSPLANISLGLTTFGFMGLFTYKYMYIYTYTSYV